MAPAAVVRRPLVLVVTNETANSFRGTWLTLIYREALQQIGYQLALRAYPTARASMLSEAGLVDGEINRTSRYHILHPNLVRVDPPHFAITFMGYARQALTLQPGWEGLRGTPYRVEYRSGTALSAVELSKVVPAGRLSDASSTILGLRKLKIGRTDIFIDLETAVVPRLAEPEFASIRQVAVMETADMHAFLHKRNGALVAELSEVLVRLKRQGFMEQCRRKATETAGG